MPFGFAILRASATALVSVELVETAGITLRHESPVLVEATRQIMAYLENPRWRFSLPINLRGTPFQRKVWAGLLEIPVSCTKTYGQFATEFESGARAIAAACRANELPLVVPCHRIVASKGLGGYAGQVDGFAVEVKKWLLKHEGALLG